MNGKSRQQTILHTLKNRPQSGTGKRACRRVSEGDAINSLFSGRVSVLLLTNFAIIFRSFLLFLLSGRCLEDADFRQP